MRFGIIPKYPCTYMTLFFAQIQPQTLQVEVNPSLYT